MSTTQYEGTTGTRKSGAEAARSEAETLRADAENTVRDVSDTVVGEAHARADAAKEGVADEISSVSKALRKASEELRGGSPQERTFGAAASSLAEFADAVRDKDLGQMVDDLGDFARRNPMAFLGGAALLGFAGVRMAKASRRARMEDDRDDRHRGAQPYYGAGPAAHGTPTPQAAPAAQASPNPSPRPAGVTPTGAAGATAARPVTGTPGAAPGATHGGKGETS